MPISRKPAASSKARSCARRCCRPRLSALTGADVYVKYENLQVTNSFKDRGALVKLTSLSDIERKRGVVAMSAGNHAQSVAYHAARLGIPATIVMPVTTPFVKVAATRSHGAEVVLDGETVAEAESRCERIRSERGMTLVHPYDDELIMAGQGTIALEMLEDAGNLDCIVIPIGGGGLISGNAIAARAIKPDIEIVGAEASLYPAVWNALHNQSRPIGGPTLAEGIAVKNVGKLTLPVIRELVADIVLVDEAHLERAVNAYLTLQKTMAEGAGAAGLAALLAKPERFKGKKVGLILCGGNIDPRILASIMVRELERESRIVAFRVTIPDRPGVPRHHRHAAGRARRQYSRGRTPPVVSRCARQGRQARRDHRDPRRRACRRDHGGDGRRRLSPRPHRQRRHGRVECRAKIFRATVSSCPFGGADTAKTKEITPAGKDFSQSPSYAGQIARPRANCG